MTSRIEPSPEVRARLQDMYLKGESLQSCALEVGMSVTWVRRVLTEEGVEFRQRGGRKDRQYAQGPRLRKACIRAMSEEGATVQEMADILGIHRRTAEYYKRKLRR